MLDKIKGEIRVYKNETKGKNKRSYYNAYVGGTKIEKDKYLNYSMLVNFSKDMEKQLDKDAEYCDILVKEAWIKAYKDKEDHIQPIFFINEGKIIK